MHHRWTIVGHDELSYVGGGNGFMPTPGSAAGCLRPASPSTSWVGSACRPDPKGIDLFDATGAPRSGTLADAITLWDAGTEVNEAPGGRSIQAPRQAKPNSGPAEGGKIRPVIDGFSYPPAQEVPELSVTAG